jgi:hypothetical protein
MEKKDKDKLRMQRCESEGNRQPSRYRRMYNLNRMVVILCLSKVRKNFAKQRCREGVEVVEIVEKLKS